VTVAERLRAEIERRKMKPTAFATFARVPQAYVSKWLNAKQGISPKFAAKLARATNQPIEYFLPTPPDPDAREALDVALEQLDEAGIWRVAHYAQRLADHQPARSPEPTRGPAPGRTGKDRRRRARSAGSAPAA